VPIIRSSRLYVCYYRLWCAVLGCWFLGVRYRAAGYASRKRDAAPTTTDTTIHYLSNHTTEHKLAAYRYYIENVVQHPSSRTHSLLLCI